MLNWKSTSTSSEGETEYRLGSLQNEWVLGCITFSSEEISFFLVDEWHQVLMKQSWEGWLTVRQTSGSSRKSHTLENTDSYENSIQAPNAKENNAL
ncbi:unnamed protein product [Caretta caretta]